MSCGIVCKAACQTNETPGMRRHTKQGRPFPVATKNQVVGGHKTLRLRRRSKVNAITMSLKLEM